MWTPDQILEIELELKRRDLTVATICEAASIDQSLWSRWKQHVKGGPKGTRPTYDNWMKVAAVLIDRIGEPRKVA